jgi:hypothetical protein
MERDRALAWCALRGRAGDGHGGKPVWEAIDREIQLPLGQIVDVGGANAQLAPEQVVQVALLWR